MSDQRTAPTWTSAVEPGEPLSLETIDRAFDAIRHPPAAPPLYEWWQVALMYPQFGIRTKEDYLRVVREHLS